MNKPQSIAKIIGINNGGERVAASAAKISTTKGDALEIYEKAEDTEKNQRLITKVMSSGHRSLIEHMVFNIAFCNVSVVVEQFMIEFRLASFTVKSRRYVDFSDTSYYIPEGLTPALRDKYTAHMDYLFEEYAFFLESGVPKEDARFILPYCFFSNFYCTLNARELMLVLERMACNSSTEIRALGEQLTEQLKETCRSVYDCVAASTCKARETELTCAGGNVSNVWSDDDKPVVLMQYPHKPVELLTAIMGVDMADNIYELIKDPRPRALEHLSYTFKLCNLTLPGITHMARHRIQSLSIPPLCTVSLKRYIIPESIGKNNPVLRQRYVAAFETNAEVAASILQESGANDLQAYFCLSGNTLDIFSTMNARELLLFFKLRTCNRAQWEIRKLASELLFILREVSGEIFDFMGPSCFCAGTCPEGKLSCGRLAEANAVYTPSHRS